MIPASLLALLPFLAAAVIVLVFGLFLMRALKGSSMGQEFKDWREEIKNWSAEKIDKTLAMLVEQNQFRLAGEMAFSLARYKDAADYFLKGSHYLGAAQSLLKSGRHKDAARIYQELEDYDKAAELFEKSGEAASAGQIYYLLGELQKSAEHFAGAGDKKRAAEVYLRAGFFRKASQFYEELGDHKNAAEVLVKAIEQAESRLGKEVAVSDLSWFQEMSIGAAENFRKAGETSRAIELLDRAHLYSEAARLFAESGKLKEAAERYKLAGYPLKAAECLEKAGESVEAAKLRAEHHLAEGKKQEALYELEKAGEWDKASQLYQELGDSQRSAEALEQAGRLKEAAEVFEKLGNYSRAASDYEKAGNFEKAAQCYEKAGETSKVSEMYEQAGAYFQAGVAFYERGLLDRAIRALQQVDRGSEDFRKACSLLGKIFQEKGMLNLAKESLKLAVDGQEVERSNVEDFYQLASLSERLGELENAMAVYEKILLVDIDYQDVRSRLERLKQSKTVIDSRSSGSSFEETQTLQQAQPLGVEKPVRYEIIEEVGRGGMGIVYKARDTILDRQVAYKVLPANLKEHPAALRNFFREAKSAARLNHPNIVTVYDAGEEAGNYYIAMEYVEGESVKAILTREGKIPAKAALLIAGQVCRALEYAHERKVIHRDVKSSNIMWTKDKVTKLMDFGLAKVLEEVKSYQTLASGTPYYMSPEQALGKEVDNRCDLYSLGVTLFEMVTGQLPFKTGDAVYHHIHTPPPEARSIDPGISEPLNAIILKCMQKDPKDRYQTAKELLEALKKIKLD
jgi:tetratricopeptide (TPR) repeat protein